MASPPSGWLPDPEAPGQLRYWDGDEWTSETEPASPATPQASPSPPGMADPHEEHSDQSGQPPFAKRKPLHKRPGTWVVASLLVVAVIAAAVSSPLEESVLGKKSASERSSQEESSGSGDSKRDDGASSDCKNTADAECTPRVGPYGGVRVDDLIWQITGVETAKKIGDQELGLDETADGVFITVRLKVRSRKVQSATLNDNVIQLETAAGEATYDADSDGTLAAMGDGGDPLFYEDIGPNQTTETEVVFDVPDALLDQDLFVRFNELGRGEPHGYIRLPKPTVRSATDPKQAS